MAHLPTMGQLEAALNEESYSYLASHFPQVLTALENEIVVNKRTPEQVRLFVVRHTLRPDIAQRCQQAAYHILALEGNQR